jgi:hypothetical protein
MTNNEKMYFEHHPKVEVFYFTSDGQAFRSKSDAESQAQRLGKRREGKGDVVTITRAEYEAALEAAQKATEGNVAAPTEDADGETPVEDEVVAEKAAPKRGAAPKKTTGK